MSTTTVSPVLLLTATVRSVERLSPSFVRICFGGEGFGEIGPDGPTLDQRLKLVFPGRSGRVPTELVRAEHWYADWLALPDGERGQVRTYTARAVKGEGADRQLVVDFVLHGCDGSGPAGPAATWAAGAAVGDSIGLLAPRRGLEGQFGGMEFTPGSARRLVLVADETAVPALASILEALPSEVTGHAVLEVPEAVDFQDIVCSADVRIEWIARGDRPRGSATIQAVRRNFGLPSRTAAAAPDGPDGVEGEVWETSIFSSSGDAVAADRNNAPLVGPDETYAWIAGDSDTVKAIRRLLVREVGMARHQVAFMGYWKVGAAQH